MIDLRDGIYFEGRSVEELKASMKREEDGVEPDKPYPGLKRSGQPRIDEHLRWGAAQGDGGGFLTRGVFEESNPRCL